MTRSVDDCSLRDLPVIHVQAIRAKTGILERWARGLMGLLRTVLRYRAPGDRDQGRPREMIKSLAAQRRRFG